MANPEVANAKHEGEQALREWVAHAEGLLARIRAVHSELQQSKNQSIHQAIHAELTAGVRGVIEVARKEGERVLLAARREAVRIQKQADEEGKSRLAQSNQAPTEIRVEAERFMERLEDTIGGPPTDEPKDPPAVPAPSHCSNGDRASSNPPHIESIDQQLIDDLWAESLGGRTSP